MQHLIQYSLACEPKLEITFLYLLMSLQKLIDLRLAYNITGRLEMRRERLLDFVFVVGSEAY